MKKEISTIAVISVFSIIILLCVVSIVSQKITQHNEKTELKSLQKSLLKKQQIRVLKQKR